MLRINAEKSGDVAVLHFRGQIVIGEEIETFQDAIRAQADACAVVIDLSEVNLIDARGLGTLLELREWAHSKGIDYRLINVNRLIHQVLEITRLDTVFQVSSKEGVQDVRPIPGGSAFEQQFTRCTEI